MIGAGRGKGRGVCVSKADDLVSLVVAAGPPRVLCGDRQGWARHKRGDA